MIVELETLEELENFGLKFGKSLKGGETILLSGPLGAGKTTFTKSVGKALGIKEDIISPTFNIVRVYNSNLGDFYHIDAYRLEDLKYDPVLDDYIFDDNAIKVIEWYNYLEDGLFTSPIVIDITVKENKTRVFNIKGDICLD